MANLIKMMRNWGYRLQATGFKLKIRPKRPLLSRFMLVTIALVVGVCLFWLYFAYAGDPNIFTEDVGIGTTEPTSKLEISGGTGYVVTEVEGVNLEGPVDVNGAITLDKTTIHGPTQAHSTVTVGANDTGYDVKFYGTTAGS